jgi:hypothetical protein
MGWMDEWAMAAVVAGGGGDGGGGGGGGGSGARTHHCERFEVVERVQTHLDQRPRPSLQHHRYHRSQMRCPPWTQTCQHTPGVACIVCLFHACCQRISGSARQSETDECNLCINYTRYRLHLPALVARGHLLNKSITPHVSLMTNGRYARLHPHTSM